MDEVFVEQIVKKKISISGILMRAIAIIFVLAGIFSMLIIGALGLTITALLIYVTYIILGIYQRGIRVFFFKWRVIH